MTVSPTPPPPSSGTNATVTFTPGAAVPAPTWLKRAAEKLNAFVKSPHGHRVEIAVIAYVVTELERRGYLPAIPIPKP